MNIKKIIEEGFKKILEDFSYQYNGQFNVPENVVQTASEALRVISKNNLTNTTGTNEGSGVEKAKSLTSKNPLSHAQLKRMKAFFDNNEKEYNSEKLAGKTIHNSGTIQSWNLWGGDNARQWVEREIRQHQSTNKTSKKLRNPKDGVRTKNLMNPNNTRIHR